MESAQSTTYEPLEGRSSGIRHEPMDSPENDIRAPKDQKHMVYLAMLAAGIGFVLPYNSFIIAADYWQARFPGRSVALDMSMTYIVVAFGTVLLNNVFLSLAPFRVRVMFGYIVSFTTLVFVAVCEVAWHMFAANTAYTVNLAAVSLVAIGCTVQQSSFYGFASMFPKRYTQAVMTGESLAGFLVSSNRVGTKLLIQNDRVSTVIFFFTSTLYILFSYLLHLATINSPFVRYHMRACAKIVLRPDEDRLNEIDGSTPTAKYGVLTLEPSSPTVPIPNKTTPAALSFSNPVYELSNPSAGESVIEGLNNLPDIPTTPQEPATPTTVAFKVEHVLTPGTCTPGKLSDLKTGFASRWQVAQSIYPYMVCIALAYCVTLSLYPGIESEIVSCSLGTWMPVLLMFTFNTSDLIGKTLAGVPYPWSRRQLILMSGLRIVLVPLLLLCCAPRHQPVISGETAAFIFTIALGVSNGLAGSLPMMLAPAKVNATLREVTGNMMTLSYNVGLTVGSFIGYVFESMLGAQLTNPCPKYPYIMDHPLYSHYTTTTTSPSLLNNATAIASAILTSTMAPPTVASPSSSSTASTTTTMETSTLLSILNTSTSTSMAAIGSITTAPSLVASTSSGTLAVLSTVAATVATIPDVVNTVVNTLVTTINDLTSTGDPETPSELMAKV
ncbi:equilibrative nucleoside transporter 4 [Musca domestica]|uniref:Equilibrative nucleoside transporter 4 n=1 Tax=Musca domestica TaxID=7370 RepID=A0A1I8N8S1_MUSDO|nr:equilibrative nucleoside transporter 4 [Musca domestica]XP_019893820.1 equilibrative nucleoside transporter 4 [Musca domestica]